MQLLDRLADIDVVEARGLADLEHAQQRRHNAQHAARPPARRLAIRAVVLQHFHRHDKTGDGQDQTQDIEAGILHLDAVHRGLLGGAQK
ncbi:hypothetical protein D3C87_1616020 [compost metagenome]